MSFPELEALKLCMGYGEGDGGRQEGRMGCIQPESESPCLRNRSLGWAPGAGGRGARGRKAPGWMRTALLRPQPSHSTCTTKVAVGSGWFP